MRLISLLILICLPYITSCKNDATETTTEPLQNIGVSAGTSESTLTDNIIGLWRYNTPVTTHFNTANFEQPNLPDLAYSYQQTVTSNRNYFEVSLDGLITLFSVVELDTDNGARHTCLHTRTQIEKWEYIFDNTYSVSNGKLSTRVDIQAKESTLFMAREDGISVFQRADTTEIDNLVLCNNASQTTNLHSRTSSKNIQSQHQLIGVWRITQFTEPVEIGFNHLNSTSLNQQYWYIDNQNQGHVWQYDESNDCVFPTLTQLNINQNGSTFILETTRHNKTTSLDVFARLLNVQTNYTLDLQKPDPRTLYLNALEHTDLSTPYFFTEINERIGVELPLCELPADEIEQLDHPLFFEELTGVWDITRPQIGNKQYLEIKEISGFTTPELIIYDYRGDQTNAGSDCYQIIKTANLAALDFNNYEERITDQFNGTVSMFKASPDELVIQSKQRRGNEYNRKLPRAEELEASGISPLCPSIRN